MLYPRSKASKLGLHLTLVYIVVTLSFMSAGVINAAASKIRLERLRHQAAATETITYRPEMD